VKMTNLPVCDIVTVLSVYPLIAVGSVQNAKVHIGNASSMLLKPRVSKASLCLFQQ